MPKTDFTQYDKDPANNTDVDGVDIAEGCAPSGINNAIRSVMSHIAEMNDGTVAMTSPDINGGTINGITDLSVSGDLTVDTNTLYVDSANNRVGIGTDSAAYFSKATFAYNPSSDNGPISVSTASFAINGGGAFHLGGKYNTAGDYRPFGSILGLKENSTDGNSAGYLSFRTNGNAADPTEHMVIDSSGNVGIGTSSPYSFSASFNFLDINGTKGGALVFTRGTNSATVQHMIRSSDDDDLRFEYGSGLVEAMRIDSSGNLLVGSSSLSFDNVSKTVIRQVGDNWTIKPYICHSFNRTDSDGSILEFYKSSSLVGSIGTDASALTINNPSTAIFLLKDTADELAIMGSVWTGQPRIDPTFDNRINLGESASRFKTLYSAGGVITTSDQNEKQQIASLTDAEITAAKAISKLFKTFKWNDAVELKGDDARTHAGVIAQDVQQAMADAGLDASKYAFWCSDTWWETQTEVPAVEAVEAVDAVYDEDGNLVSEAVEAVEAKEAYTRTDTYDTAEEAPAGATERTRLGIRYPELLAFIGAATEQRLASIEARLDALEA